jgi:hypothetical protein
LIFSHKAVVIGVQNNLPDKSQRSSLMRAQIIKSTMAKQKAPDARLSVC